jgi:hypothetical protein
MRLFAVRIMQIAAALTISACQNRQFNLSIPVAPEGPVSFRQVVLPVFTTTCGGFECHLGETTSGVNLSNYDAIMASEGVQYRMRIVIPGQAETSPIIDKLLAHPTHGSRMPLGGRPLSSEDVGRIVAWIRDGADND